MKLKSTADGLFGEPVNPHEKIGGWPEVIGTAWLAFEKRKVKLPLTTPMPGNTVFEGVEVWQYFDDECKEWFSENENAYKRYSTIEEYANAHAGYSSETRRAYKPLEVKEQVREEAFDPDKKDIAIDDEGKELVSYNELIGKASNPELWVESKANLYLINTFFDNDVDPEIIKKVYADAYLEATQQQGLELKYKIGLMKVWHKAYHNEASLIEIARMIDEILDRKSTY